MMKKYFIVALLLSLTCGVCHAQRQNSGVKEFEAECLGVEGDGSQTIRAYGFGKDKDDAVERASANIQGVKTTLVGTLNVYEVLKYEKLILTKASVEKIEEVYA